MSPTSHVPTRADTRTAIVEVAARLLHEQGLAGVTTRGVAEAAGVQAPTLYRLFGDKDGLLDAVAEHVLATFVAAKAAAAAAELVNDADPLDDLKASWQSQIEFGLANPALFVLLSDPARGQRSPAIQAGGSILEARVRRVALSGRLRVSERRAVELIRAAGTGAIHTILTAPPDRRDQGLADELFEAVLRQIVADVPDLPDRDLLSVTVAFRGVAADLDMLSEPERRLMAEWLDRAIEQL